jgi:hypothetical protein
MQTALNAELVSEPAQPAQLTRSAGISAIPQNAPSAWIASNPARANPHGWLFRPAPRRASHTIPLDARRYLPWVFLLWRLLYFAAMLPPGNRIISYCDLQAPLKII